MISHFIDSMVRNCIDSEFAGMIINPWRQFFMLTKELMKLIINTDGDAEYTVPDVQISAALGS